MEISIAICDDENIFVDNLYNILKKLFKDSYTQIPIIYNFTSGFKLINAVKNGVVLDIIFLDIELSKDNILGTEIGTTIKQLNPDVLIIYTSFYNCYDRNITRAEPFDFLTKPIQHEELIKTVDRALSRIQYLKPESLFTYKSKGNTYQINIKDVLYFESKHRIINIHFKDGNIHEFYDKLDNVELYINDICDYFLRPSKSYLVNFYFLSRVSNTSLLISDIEINIGQKYHDSFLNKMRPLVKH